MAIIGDLILEYNSENEMINKFAKDLLNFGISDNDKIDCQVIKSCKTSKIIVKINKITRKGFVVEPIRNN